MTGSMEKLHWTGYCLSWSPMAGEATFTRIFRSEEERSRFLQGIAPISRFTHTWENEYLA